MRDPNRIDDFLLQFGKIWKEQCPDWRFGQLISNVFIQMNFDPFMLEEDEMIYEIEKYFGLINKTSNFDTIHKKQRNEVKISDEANKNNIAKCRKTKKNNKKT